MKKFIVNDTLTYLVLSVLFWALGIQIFVALISGSVCTWPLYKVMDALYAGPAYIIACAVSVFAAIATFVEFCNRLDD